jgi:hypothetical protein
LRADASEDWLQRWEAAETWYFDRLRPANQFDFAVEEPGEA